MIGTRRGAAGHHPARREDDHRGLRGDGAEGLRRRPQGVRGRPVRDGRARRSSRRPCLALPTAKIAVMGAGGRGQRGVREQDRRDRDEAERAAYVERLREEYETDIDMLRLASELVIDAIVEPRELRRELIARFAAAATKDRALLDARTAYRRCRAQNSLQTSPPNRKGASVGNRAPPRGGGPRLEVFFPLFDCSLSLAPDRGKSAYFVIPRHENCRLPNSQHGGSAIRCERR